MQYIGIALSVFPLTAYAITHIAFMIILFFWQNMYCELFVNAVESSTMIMCKMIQQHTSSIPGVIEKLNFDMVGALNISMNLDNC